MALEREDLDRLKEIFVTRQECELSMTAVESKVNEENIRLAVIEHQLKNITWLIMTVGAGVITVILKIFFGG